MKKWIRVRISMENSEFGFFNIRWVPSSEESGPTAIWVEVHDGIVFNSIQSYHDFNSNSNFLNPRSLTTRGSQ